MTDNGSRSWLLYGANGYTGELIAREAARRGMRPTLAGRSRDKLEPLARELDLPWTAFGLDDASGLAEQLRGHSVVLNCAGPFSKTAGSMIEGCLNAQAHYLDITGEIDVIESAFGRDTAARSAGVTVMPAVGFDVVPTDCVAKMLADDLPDATHLALAFSGIGGMSPGTAKTMLEALTQGVRARRDGRIVVVPDEGREIPFPDGSRKAVLISWGDVASAYHSTGIANIDTYMAPPDKEAALLRLSGVIRWLAGFGPVHRWMARQIEQRVKGPDERELRDGHTVVWGEVRNDRGERRSRAIRTPGGYALTVLTALAAVERVQAGQTKPGFSTPSQAFGKGFILEMSGVRELASG